MKLSEMIYALYDLRLNYKDREVMIRDGDGGRLLELKIEEISPDLIVLQVKERVKGDTEKV